MELTYNDAITIALLREGWKLVPSGRFLFHSYFSKPGRLPMWEEKVCGIVWSDDALCVHFLGEGDKGCIQEI